LYCEDIQIVLFKVAKFLLQMKLRIWIKEFFMPGNKKCTKNQNSISEPCRPILDTAGGYIHVYTNKHTASVWM